MKTNYSLCLFVSLCTMTTAIFSCKNTLRTENNYISVSRAFDTNITGRVEEHSKSISLIPLETNDTILIGSNPIVKLISDDDIIIESDRRLYRFDKNGRFVNYIGRPGQGPDEYVSPGGVSYNDTDSCLYLFNRALQKWTLDGRLETTVQFDELYNLNSISILKPDTLLAIRRNYTGDGMLSQFIQYYTINGDFISECEFQSDSLKMDIAMFASPEHHRLDDAYLFRNEWGNEIYNITPNGISLFLNLDFGRHNPDRLVYQDGYQRDKHLSKDIANIKSCYISKDLVWVNYIMDEKLNNLLVDKANNIIHHTVSENDYIVPDGLRLYEELNFWPTYIDTKSRLYSILQPGELSEQQLENLSKHLNSQRNISTEDNPVLCCVEF